MKRNNTIKLERYRLDELPPSWKRELDEAAIQDDLKALEESDREILEQYAPAAMAAAIRGKMEKASSGRAPETDNTIPFGGSRRKGRTMLLIPAAAVILFALLLPAMIFRNGSLEETTAGSPREITRVKGLGEPELKVYRKLGAQTEQLEEYSSAGESDLIQLGYRVSSQVYGLIISIDGRGVVTRHLPEQDENAARLQTGGEHHLPYSYELDDAPQYETFYLITSDQPFPLDPVIDIIAGAARDNGIVLDIPVIMEDSGLKADITGEIRQYAVPIKKED